MAGGLGLVGRQGAQSLRDKVSGASRTMSMTNAADKSVGEMKSALDLKKKMQAMEKVTQAGSAKSQLGG